MYNSKAGLPNCYQTTYTGSYKEPTMYLSVCLQVIHCQKLHLASTCCGCFCFTLLKVEVFSKVRYKYSLLLPFLRTPISINPSVVVVEGFGMLLLTMTTEVTFLEFLGASTSVCIHRLSLKLSTKRRLASGYILQVLNCNNDTLC